MTINRDVIDSRLPNAVENLRRAVDNPAEELSIGNVRVLVLHLRINLQQSVDNRPSDQGLESYARYLLGMLDKAN